MLREEGRRLLAAWPQAPVVAALAVDGEALDTRRVRGALQRAFERGGAGFVIGGSLGLADEVRARADGRAVALGAHAAAPARARGAARAALPRRQDPARRAVPPLSAASGAVARARAGADRIGGRRPPGRRLHETVDDERRPLRPERTRGLAAGRARARTGGRRRGEAAVAGRRALAAGAPRARRRHDQRGADHRQARRTRAARAGRGARRALDGRPRRRRLRPLRGRRPRLPQPLPERRLVPRRPGPPAGRGRRLRPRRAAGRRGARR